MYGWFLVYVIATMLVDEDKRSLISFACSSTSNCTLQRFLCLYILQTTYCETSF